MVAIKLPEVGQEIEWKLPSAESTKPMNFKADTIIDDEFKLVCYFTNWAWYRQEGGRFLPEDLDPELCTHILYGFAVLDSNSLTIKSHDPWADIDNSKFYSLFKLLFYSLTILLNVDISRILRESCSF